MATHSLVRRAVRLATRLNRPIESTALRVDGEEAVRGEIDPIEPRVEHELAKLGVRHACAYRPQPRQDLSARIECRHCVQVGGGGGGGGHGVCHLVRSGLGHVASRERDAEGARGHLAHLGVQPLAHFSASVRDQHRTVRVHVHERASLVHELGGEIDSEFGGAQSDAPLAPPVRLVELGHSRTARVDLGVFAQLRPRARHTPLVRAERLSKRDLVARRVQVGGAQLERGNVEGAREVLDDVLSREQPLWATKAAEGRGRGRVRAAHDAARPEGGPKVRVVHVEECAVEDRDREVEKGATVAMQSDVECRELWRPTRWVWACGGRVRGYEGVPTACGAHVDVAAQREAHRAAQQVSGERARARGEHGARLLAAEAAAHAPTLDDHLVARRARHVRHELLRLVDRLCRAEQLEAAIVGGRGVATVRLEVEMLLPTHSEGSAHDDEPWLGEHRVHIGAVLELVV